MKTIPDYQSAIDLFEATRDAAIDLRDTMYAIERMKASEGLKGASYAPIVASTATDVNKTAAICGRIDYEQAMAGRMRECEELITYTAELCGGVTMLLGIAKSTAVYGRYVSAMTWAQVANLVGYSQTWCRAAVVEVCELIDSLGAERVMAGVGMAEPE